MENYMYVKEDRLNELEEKAADCDSLERQNEKLLELVKRHRRLLDVLLHDPYFKILHRNYIENTRYELDKEYDNLINGIF